MTTFPTCSINRVIASRFTSKAQDRDGLHVNLLSAYTILRLYGYVHWFDMMVVHYISCNCIHHPYMRSGQPRDVWIIVGIVIVQLSDVAFQHGSRNDCYIVLNNWFLAYISHTHQFFSTTYFSFIRFLIWKQTAMPKKKQWRNYALWRNESCMSGIHSENSKIASGKSNHIKIERNACVYVRVCCVWVCSTLVWVSKLFSYNLV